jgi:predicted ArsR family transcriptional regulator
MPALPEGLTGRTRRPNELSVVLDVLDALIRVPRATVDKLAEDTDRHPDSVRRRLALLVERGFVQEAGRLPRMHGARGRGAMTYRLHPRFRTGAPKRTNTA